MKKGFIGFMALIMAVALVAPYAQAKIEKIGYVDLRKAFYEYEKTKNLETELNTVTQSSQEKRTKMVTEITKMRDELQLLNGKAKDQKQAALEKKLQELQEFDRQTRQMLLNRKNDMFREVIDDIQKVVDNMGKKGNYDYILDARNVMFGKPAYDLTEEVIKTLNKK